MVVETDRSFAQVGRLITARVEASQVAVKSGKDDSSDKDEYQIARDTVKDINKGDFTEIILLKDHRLTTPRDITCLSIQLPRPPSKMVYAIWKDHLMGPFETTVEDGNGLPGTGVSARFKADTVKSVSVVSSPFLKGVRERADRPEVKFVANANAASEQVECIIVETSALERELSRGESLSVASVEVRLKKLAKEFLTRRSQQEFQQLLNELADHLGKRSASADEGAFVEELCKAASSNLVSMQQMADNLWQSGLIEQYVKRYVDVEIDNRSDEILLAANRKAEPELKRLQSETQALAELIKRQNTEIQRNLDEFADLKRAEEEQLAVDRQAIIKERQVLEQQLLPILTRLNESRNDVVNEVLSLLPLLSKISPNPVNTQGVTITPPGLVKAPDPPLRERSGKPVSDWSAFIEQRLCPSLNRWNPGVTRDQALLFHAGVVACRMMLVPNYTWARAYCDALDGELTVAHVEPDWLTFSRAWNGQVEASWKRAIQDQSRVHVIMFSGVDRTPTSAWAQPWFGIASGVCERLPSEGQVTWRDNLRMMFSFERGPAAFVPSDEFRYSSGAAGLSPVAGGPANATPREMIAGHVTGDEWYQWTLPSAANDLMATISSPRVSDATRKYPAWLRCMNREVHQLVRVMVAYSKTKTSDKRDAVAAALETAVRIRIEWPSEYFSPTA